jgi:hypothetical protein
MNPFLRPDNPREAEVFTDGAVHILAVRGIDQFSVRAIARWMRVSSAAILNEYSRARVLELITICFSARWLQWSGSGDWWSDPTAAPLRLPETDDEVHGVRVMQALHQLALAERQRGNPLPVGHLSDLRRDELKMLGVRLRRYSSGLVQASDDDVVKVMMVVDGLRVALAQPSPELSWADAHRLLEATVRQVRQAREGERDAGAA